MNLKGKLFALAAIASASAFVSCSNSDATTDFATTQEQTATVTFTAALPGEIASRSGETTGAYGDGTKATTLYYAVYSLDTQNGNTTTTLVLTNYGKTGDTGYKADEVTFSNLNAKVSFTLPVGKTYKFAFWAQSPDATSYSFVPATGDIKVDYSSMLCNDDNNDAFFANATLVFGFNTTAQTITLTRPFAQLNIGITDSEAAAEYGLEIQKSHISILGVCKNLNLLTGVASEISYANSVNYQYNTIPALQQNTGVFPAKENGEYIKAQYSAMTYVLVPEGAQALDIQFNYVDVNDLELNLNDVHYLHNVKFERNHRTNIYGDMLLSTQEWTIQIDPSFINPDYDNIYEEV